MYKRKQIKKWKVDSISEKAFRKYHKRYQPKINRDTTKVTWTDTSFQIRTENGIKSFKADKRDYSSFHYYLGYLETLHLYAIHDIEARNEIGWLHLVDSKTGKGFDFSIGDEPLTIPYVSPHGSFLLAYVNSLYESESTICILKIVTKGNRYSLHDYYGLSIPKAEIQELAWVDDYSFVLSLNEMEEQQARQKRYLRFRLRK